MQPTETCTLWVTAKHNWGCPKSSDSLRRPRSWFRYRHRQLPRLELASGTLSHTIRSATAVVRLPYAISAKHGALFLEKKTAIVLLRPHSDLSVTHVPCNMSTTGYSVEQGKAGVYSLGPTQSSEQKEGVEEAAAPMLTPEQEKKLWRKVDTRLLPIVTLMFLCSFMDRGEPSHTSGAIFGRVN